MSKKNLLSFLLGGIIGTGITYICMKQHYDKLLTYVYAEPDDDELLDEEEIDGEILINPSPELIVNARKRDTYTDYTKYNKHDVSKESTEDVLHPVDSHEDEAPALSDEEVRDLEGERLTKEVNNVKGNSSTIITVDEYGCLAGFDTASLMYYVYDDTLATEEDDEIIHDEKTLLGDCLDQFNWKNSCDEGDNLYARNFSLSTDYEIIPVLGSYVEMVGDIHY